MPMLTVADFSMDWQLLESVVLGSASRRQSGVHVSKVTQTLEQVFQGPHGLIPLEVMAHGLPSGSHGTQVPVEPSQ